MAKKKLPDLKKKAHDLFISATSGPFNPVPQLRQLAAIPTMAAQGLTKLATSPIAASRISTPPFQGGLDQAIREAPTLPDIFADIGYQATKDFNNPNIPGTASGAGAFIGDIAEQGLASYLTGNAINTTAPNVVPVAAGRGQSLLAEAALRPATRPWHQVQIENAINSGDIARAKQIVDSLADTDPYKKGMLLFLKHR